MTDTPETAPPAHQNLDIGRVISDSFSIYFKNLPLFFVAVFIPYFGLDLAINQLIGQPTITDLEELVPYFQAIGLAMIPTIVVMIFVQAIIVYMAVSIRVGRGAALGPAVNAAFQAFLPIFGFSLLFMAIGGLVFAGAFGLMTASPGLIWIVPLLVLILFVPGLFVTAMFYVFIPAIVFEQAGFGALVRSLRLTSGYRTAIVGLMVVLFLIMMLASMVIGGIVGGVMVGVLLNNPDMLNGGDMVRLPWWYSFFNAGVSALTVPISMIPPAVVYARLKEIKEGGQADDLMRVFE